MTQAAEEDKQKVSKDKEEKRMQLGKLIVDEKEGRILLQEALVDKEIENANARANGR